jgi:hypothetical protein
VALSVLEEENAALKQDLDASKKREEQMSHEVAALHQKLADANPEGIAQRFLASRAFSNAAMLSCEDMMKYILYDEFRRLGKVYPFVPEQLGYVALPVEVARPKSLRGYNWDVHDDLLVGPDGKKLVGTYNVRLRSQPPTVIHYPWPKDKWPEDPAIPPPRRSSGRQTPRIKVSASGTSQAKATQPSPSRRAEKAPVEKASGEKAPAEKAPAEKASGEKAPAEKASGGKAPGEDEEGSSAKQGSSLPSIFFGVFIQYF